MILRTITDAYPRFGAGYQHIGGHEWTTTPRLNGNGCGFGSFYAGISGDGCGDGDYGCGGDDVYGYTDLHGDGEGEKMLLEDTQ
jgi:hypothetical protein